MWSPRAGRRHTAQEVNVIDNCSNILPFPIILQNLCGNGQEVLVLGNHPSEHLGSAEQDHCNRLDFTLDGENGK